MATSTTEAPIAPMTMRSRQRRPNWPTRGRGQRLGQRHSHGHRKLTLAAEDDAERRRALRRMKAIPLALLAGAAVLFIVAWYFEKQPDAPPSGDSCAQLPRRAWSAARGLVRRHRTLPPPMGLPIPHTALIPQKKDQLGASLGDFVRQNFLNPETVRARGNPPTRPADSAPICSSRGARATGRGRRRAAVAGVRSIDDADAQLIIRNLIFQQAAATPGRHRPAACSAR